MTGSAAHLTWGSWVLGDLADCVRRTAELVGGTFEPVRVSAAPPRDEGEVPRVVVVVSDEHTASRVRRHVIDENQEAWFIDPGESGLWRCQVEDIDITMTVERPAPSW